MKFVPQVLALAAALVAAPSWAQAQCYTTQYGASIGVGDDTVLPAQLLQFSFPFHGRTFNTVYVSTNGFLYLSNTGSTAPTNARCCTGSAATMVTSADPMICAWWTDLNMISGQGDVKVDNQPNSVTITWDNAVEYGSTVTFDMQIQLKSTGEIIMFFDPNMSCRTSGDDLTGMSPGVGSTVPLATNYATASTPFLVGDTNFQITNNAGSPLSIAGKSLSFLPTGANQYLVQLLNCASTHTSYGLGCVRSFGSFYELFTPASNFDLSNSSITMLNTGAGYTVLPGISAWIAPGANAVTTTLGDDTEYAQALPQPLPSPTGPVTSLQVCSNGFVSLGGSNGTSFSPSATTMLGNVYSAFYCWHDFNAATTSGGGQVKFEQVGTIAVITWDGVWDYGGTSAANANTWQLQLDCATGNATFVWQTMSTLGGSTATGFLVGYSPGGASADPGNTDLSVAVPATFSVGSADVLPLTLSAAPAPRAGATVVYTANNVPSGTVLCAHALGFAAFIPGVDLSGFGAPGCSQYLNTAAGVSNLVFGAGTTYSSNFSIPNMPFVLGLTLHNQYLSLTPSLNALGIATSNLITSNIQAF